jgi:hypothetical protein
LETNCPSLFPSWHAFAKTLNKSVAVAGVV